MTERGRRSADDGTHTTELGRYSASDVKQSKKKVRAAARTFDPAVKAGLYQYAKDRAALFVDDAFQRLTQFDLYVFGNGARFAGHIFGDQFR